MSAKEMFEELGYEYSYDDGYIEYLIGTPIPDRINTNYISFKKISFNKMDRQMSVYGYQMDALCQKRIIKKNFINDVYIFSDKELKAINKQVEELGWD